MHAFAPATTAGGLVYASGTSPGPQARVEPVAAQLGDVFRRLDATLQEHGSSLARALSIHVQVRNASDFAAMNAAYAPFFPAEPPVRTTIVAAPELPDALVQISAVAAAAGAPREVLHPAGWPVSPNPYSYAVRSGELVFLSGLVPRDGRTNAVVAGPLDAQVATIFDNAAAILAAADLSLDDIVSARVFLTDAANAPAADECYRRHLRPPRPARATVIAALMNPSYLVEMTFVAMAGKRQIGVANAASVPDAIASPAMRAGSHVFLSAFGGDDAGESLDASARTATGRIVDALGRAGLAWADIAEITVCVSDAADAAAARQAIRDAAGEALPAGTTIVCGLLPHDARVQIAAIAVG
jgi:2-iminobutanoate/2-iminopropanoate deaminase